MMHSLESLAHMLLAFTVLHLSRRPHVRVSLLASARTRVRTHEFRRFTSFQTCLYVCKIQCAYAHARFCPAIVTCVPMIRSCVLNVCTRLCAYIFGDCILRAQNMQMSSKMGWAYFRSQPSAIPITMAESIAFKWSRCPSSHAILLRVRARALCFLADACKFD